MRQALSKHFVPIIFQTEQRILTKSIPEVSFHGYRGRDFEKLAQKTYTHIKIQFIRQI